MVQILTTLTTNLRVPVMCKIRILPEVSQVFISSRQFHTFLAPLLFAIFIYKIIISHCGFWTQMVICSIPLVNPAVPSWSSGQLLKFGRDQLTLNQVALVQVWGVLDLDAFVQTHGRSSRICITCVLLAELRAQAELCSEISRRYHSLPP